MTEWYPCSAPGYEPSDVLASSAEQAARDYAEDAVKHGERAGTTIEVTVHSLPDGADAKVGATHFRVDVEVRFVALIVAACGGAYPECEEETE